MTPTAAVPAHQRVAPIAAPLPPLGRPIWLPPAAWPFETRALTVEGATLAVTARRSWSGPAVRAHRLLVVHHRAKRSMDAYNRRRAIPTDDRRRATSVALAQFLQLLNDADIAGIERMLASDVGAVTDGGGEFSASRRPIVGPARVARFFLKLRESRPRLGHVQIVELNSFPAALIEFDAPMGRRPPRVALAVDVDCSGLIARLWAIANSQKLSAIRSSAKIS